ncbi:MAG: ABC transporter ATP-binding protein [Magnetospirillum sp.]|nr:ABC transporter ATP-binding protein [Magnetospirillum sp.]
MKLLSSSAIDVYYGDFQALFGLSVDVNEGETIAIIGSNGAGKSTFLKTISGQMRPKSGTVSFCGKDVTGIPANKMVGMGIALVPEGRRLFPSLSVEENIVIGGLTKRPGPWNLKRVYELFPVLVSRRNVPGTSLSGGQQQMVAIGRALMSNPKLLLCDEISLGLAPIVVKDIYASFPAIIGGGTSVVIVEQDISQALKVADRFYCFQEGRVSLDGIPGHVDFDAISQAYFGV